MHCQTCAAGARRTDPRGSRKEADTAASILKEAMESAVQLSIPFISEVKTGKSWYHTK